MSSGYQYQSPEMLVRIAAASVIFAVLAQLLTLIVGIVLIIRSIRRSESPSLTPAIRKYLATMIALLFVTTLSMFFFATYLTLNFEFNNPFVGIAFLILAVVVSQPDVTKKLAKAGSSTIVCALVGLCLCLPIRAGVLIVTLGIMSIATLSMRVTSTIGTAVFIVILSFFGSAAWWAKQTFGFEWDLYLYQRVYIGLAIASASIGLIALTLSSKSRRSIVACAALDILISLSSFAFLASRLLRQ